MRITKCKFKMRCEAEGCSKFADHTVFLKRTVLRNALNLCDGCLKELHDEAAKLYVPGSIKSPLSKKEEGVVSKKALKKKGLEVSDA